MKVVNSAAKKLWSVAIVAAACAMAVSGVGRAEPDAGAPPAAAKPPITERVEPPKSFHDPHWEYGFDLKGTQIVGKFTPLLGAHWQYIFRNVGTHLGIGAEALPQIVRRDIEGGREKVMLYTYGLQAAQPFLNDESLQVGVEVFAGYATSNIRVIPDVAEESLVSPSFKIIEPGIYATFLSWEELDVGVVASMRLALGLDTPELKAADMSGVTLGVTFRERRH